MRRLRLLRLFGLLAVLSAAACGGMGQTFTSTPAPLPPTPVATPVVLSTAPSDPLPAYPATVTSAPATTEPKPPATAIMSTPAGAATTEPDIAATLTAGSVPRLYAAYPSPDGRRRAEVHIFDCALFPDGGEYAYDRLQIGDTAGGEARFIDGQLQSCGGLGAFGLAGLFWSPSGRYFYYTDAREGAPDGCGYWSRPTSRVDTTDWTTADLGGGPLSPDGLLLAVWDERDLVVYEVDGEEVGRVAAAADALALGPIAWSPDSRSLAFVQAAMFCIPGQSGATTVGRVDVPSLTSRVLLRSEDPAFQDVKWDEPEMLRLTDDQGREWLFDIAGGELSAAP